MLKLKNIKEKVQECVALDVDISLLDIVGVLNYGIVQRDLKWISQGILSEAVIPTTEQMAEELRE